MSYDIIQELVRRMCGKTVMAVEERDALREKIVLLEAELACAKAFHDVAVKERDTVRLP